MVAEVTITKDHISFNDDGTAWLVDIHRWGGSIYRLDRPCDYCQRNDLSPMSAIGFVCPAMCIDGRHTFTIEVEEPLGRGDVFPDPGWFTTHRVSIIPGMVLPIVGSADHDPGELCAIVEITDDGEHCLWPEGIDNHFDVEWITLPPAAAPGMWAVKLKVLR